MPQAQRDLALRSITIAQQGLDITVNSPAYREGMKYGTAHYDFFSLVLTGSRTSRSLHSCNCDFCRYIPITIGSPFVRFSNHLAPVEVNTPPSPNECNMQDITVHVERLASLMAESTLYVTSGHSTFSDLAAQYLENAMH